MLQETSTTQPGSEPDVKEVANDDGPEHKEYDKGCA